MNARCRWYSIFLLIVGFTAGLLFRASPTTQADAAGAALALAASKTAVADDGKLRIIAFGAHPDDCEIKAGGVAAKWAALGHHVKFVSVTNGDVGHWRMAGGPLARRRAEEVKRAAQILGIQTDVLDIHDGELEPTLTHRRTITRLIRDWKADVVLAHRPNDYHPDHRYTGLLVQDAAYMVTVPFFCPDTPSIKNNPTFFYYSDRFQRPNPFRADVVVPIDDVVDKKLAALEVIESQFLEGGVEGSTALIPKDDAERGKRQKVVRQAFMNRDSNTATKYRAKLTEWVGEKRAAQTQYAEAFELCEYGRQPNREELAKLFPFFAQGAEK